MAGIIRQSLPAGYLNVTNQTVAEAAAAARGMYLNGTLTIVYTPPPITAGFPFITLRYALRDSLGDYSLGTTAVRVVVRHLLDDALSRFVRLPTWAFRPLAAPLNQSVDWWAGGAVGVDPASLSAADRENNWCGGAS